jgi:hypothetical protein
MGKKLYVVKVPGKSGDYWFKTYVDPRYQQDWWDDGVEILPAVNSIPRWIVNVGFERIWCFFQDCFQMRNPLK